MFIPTPTGDCSGGDPPRVFTSDRPIRSLAKAISWRVTGSLDTMLLSWFFTKSLTIAAAIGLTEVVTKMVLYYLHERVWNRISLGRAQGMEGPWEEAKNTSGATEQDRIRLQKENAVEAAKLN